MIVIDKLKFIKGTILPPSGYKAITLFGYVLTHMTDEEVIEYAKTDRGKRLITHETTHILQKEECSNSWLFFYVLYIWYFFKMYLCTFQWKVSYKTIPFELEAYFNEVEPISKSHWRMYRMNNKKRQEIFKKYF